MEFTTAQWQETRVIVGHGPLEPGRPVKLLIGFHGADSTPENMLIHGSRLSLSNAVHVFPQGPVDAGEGLWSWWQDGPKQKETVAEFLEYSRSLLTAAFRFVEDQTQGVGPHETCLWGFSQGAAAALVLTLLGGHPIHRTASICGFLPELPEPAPGGGVPSRVLGIFGANDNVVPSFLADFALEEVRSRGHQLTAKETVQGHEINAENLKDLTEFFET